MRALKESVQPTEKGADRSSPPEDDSFQEAIRRLGIFSAKGAEPLEVRQVVEAYTKIDEVVGGISPCEGRLGTSNKCPIKELEEEGGPSLKRGQHLVKVFENGLEPLLDSEGRGLAERKVLECLPNVRRELKDLEERIQSIDGGST
ncbi:hypothetical protein ACLOJK_005624 [Asimina triloba]